MSDDSAPLIPNEITARLVAEAQATITRDMAGFVRTAIKYNIDTDTFARLMAEAKGLPQASASTAPITATAPPPYDGRWRGLIDCYERHERSPMHNLKHSVRLNYARSFNRLRKDIGDQRVADWTAKIAQKQYEEWSADNKIAMGHELIGKVRLLCGFGTTELHDDACIKLSTILGSMRFPVAKGDGSPRLTREQARALRITAREHFGWDSIALAIALLLSFRSLSKLTSSASGSRSAILPSLR
ncbi:hypothetical protein ACU4GH_03230 [Bradyrhizobium betae]